MLCFKTTLPILLAAMLASTGCSEPKDTAKPTAPPTTNRTATEKHAPHGAGPNGGVVFDLGSHHAEFTVDHPKQQCTILFLGDDEKTPTAVAASEFILSIKETKTADGTVVAPMTVTMTPVDADAGKSNKFVGSDPGIGNVADFEGTLAGEINGKPVMGEFQE
ncbi:hypothetical protein [Botrimarina mediterranea]|uniref:hypothetical protein n=1 Tax=Botrimarina mediterranea TaxID=2528022 RepID=UPI00118CD0FE|nr:hypothetical protein K2D_19960 [Planctomycetes bacterium K2D]